ELHMGSPLPPETDADWRLSANSKYLPPNVQVSSHDSPEHEPNRAKDFGALTQFALEHLDVVRRGADRAPSQRLAQRLEQQLARVPEIPADHDFARVEEVAERRDGGAD